MNKQKKILNTMEKYYGLKEAQEVNPEEENKLRENLRKKRMIWATRT